MNYSKYKQYLINWLQQEVKQANLQGVVLGMSGGVDSSVVAVLAKEAFPDNSLGVYLPIENMLQDFEDVQIVAKQIKIKTMTVDLTTTYASVVKTFSIKNKLVNANIKSRLRMLALYALAQEHKYLVLGTGNAAEWLLGYFTKYGDGGVDLLPLIHLTKSEVQAMAKFMKLPRIIYTKTPTAGLWDGQTDESELGFSYKNVDNYIKKKPINPSIFKKIKHQQKITQHKRKLAPTPNKPQ